MQEGKEIESLIKRCGKIRPIALTFMHENATISVYKKIIDLFALIEDKHYD
jgi:hypothetical protein